MPPQQRVVPRTPGVKARYPRAVYRNAEPRCVEIIGAIECMEPRRSQEVWPPYRRLGRVRDASGQWHLVRVTDFGTARERFAADDTWNEAQVRAYLAMRVQLGAPFSRPPIEVGIIVPEREGEELPRGHYVPPDHLEVQPRLFAVEEVPDGTGVPLLVDDPPLPSPVARAVLVALHAAFATLLLGPWRDPSSVLTPGHLDIELWLLQGGVVEVRPRFRYVPSLDYVFSTTDLNAAAAQEATLAGHLERLLTSLLDWADVDGRATSAVHLATMCRALDRREVGWPPCLPSAAPPLVGEWRDALAEHVERHLREHESHHGPVNALLRGLAPAGPAVRRWQTRSLAPHG